jgi:hypothetical protein
MEDPQESHLEAIKGIVCYVKVSYGIKYCNDKLKQLVGYTDSNCTRDGDC